MNAPLVDIHTHLPEITGQLSIYSYDPSGNAQRVDSKTGSDTSTSEEPKQTDTKPFSSVILTGTDILLSLPSRPYSTGIHPWQIQMQPIDSGLLELLRTSITSKTLAIGEIGLDFHTARTVQERQRQCEGLQCQLQEAAEHRLPVIIHCVKAWEELLALLKEFPKIPIILHGFIGSPQLAERALAAGFYLSFGSRAFRSPKTLLALQHTPPDRLFLETDTIPEPALTTLYEQAAETLQLTPVALREHIFTNYQHLFNSTLGL